MSLGRSDLSGKTGTTNERRDAWFSGFNADLVATVWVGFDEEQSLGAREEGSRTALPIWIDFMGDALQGMPERIPPKPSGLVTVRISPETGRVARANDGDAIFETFRVDHVPERDEEDAPSPYEPEEQTEPLF
jgi:penicillin-binding protein 1A